MDLVVKYIPWRNDQQAKPPTESTTSALDDNNEQQVVLPSLLADVHYGLLSARVKFVRKAIIEYYTRHFIVEVRQFLFDKVGNDVIGVIKDCRDGNTRSKTEADVKDILAAMVRLDKSTHTPIYAVPSYKIYAVPRSHHEELSSISVIDRLLILKLNLSNVNSMLTSYFSITVYKVTT